MSEHGSMYGGPSHAPQPPPFSHVPAHVSSWVQNTPLPTALAVPDDTASVASYSTAGTSSKKKKRKNKESSSNVDAPLIIAPGRSARASVMPTPLNLTHDVAGPINPLEFLDDPPVSQQYVVSSTVIGKAGLVRDRDGLVYDPENPRRTLYSGEDGRASRIPNAVSSKQAKAIRERAIEEQDYEKMREEEEEEHRRQQLVQRLAGDAESENDDGSSGDDSDDDAKRRVVHRLPKNAVAGGVRHRHRLSQVTAKSKSKSKSKQKSKKGVVESSEDSDEGDGRDNLDQGGLRKIGGKVAPALDADSMAKATRDFLFMSPGRSRLPSPPSTPSISSKQGIVIRRESDDELDSDPFDDTALSSKRKKSKGKLDTASFLKPGRTRKPKPGDGEIAEAQVESDSGTSEEEDVDIAAEVKDDEDDDDENLDDVPLNRLNVFPKKPEDTADGVADALAKLNVAAEPEDAQKIEEDEEETDAEALSAKMEDMRRLCKQAKEDPMSALTASKFIIEHVKDLEGDLAAQKYLCNLAVRALKKVGTSNVVSPDVAAESQHLLANLHVSGIPGFQDRHRPDYTKAFVLYASAAKKGHADALFHVALCYEQGAGVPLSNPRSLHNYKKSARMNHPGAMFRLGMALLRGELSLNPNIRDGIKWLRLSAKYANEQYPHALYELAMMHDNPIDKNIVWTDHAYVVELLSKGAELGHSLCQHKLGEAYEYGMYGLAVDPSRSVYYYSLAAANGQTEAMFELGGWYLTGASDTTTNFTLPQSDSEARRWVSLAAEAGLPRAMFAMGYFEERGIGNPDGPDNDESLKWYRRAAEEGDEKAIKKMEEWGLTWKKEEKKKGTLMSLLGGSSNSTAAVMGTNGNNLQLGSYEKPQFSIRKKRAHLDEELDGGNKCLVM
ncbi:hypothetical protein HDU97_003104 [Phlyctochytrium planicorne]|nr:hypothetical protein HDU97_003056 [Phlyctochytrium planicorne]KAJ3109676.1 hypothetical protein HDU97_003104 [Phlyctochytrium planicorne]